MGKLWVLTFGWPVLRVYAPDPEILMMWEKRGYTPFLYLIEPNQKSEWKA